MRLNLIINCALCIVNCALLSSCGAQKQITTTHTERIEERVMPVAVGADTIEITLPHTENNWLTEPEVLSLGEKRTDNTEDAVATPAEDRFISDFEQSEKSKFREPTVFEPLAKKFRGFRERTNNSVSEKENSVRNNNSAGVKSVEICRATLAQQESESLNPDGKKSSQSVLSVGDKKSRSEKKSVHSVGSVREKNNSVRNTNSVRISSTRGINISRHETDTTSTLRITLRPDTVFVPYTNHIRSDTIVVPDRICKLKLQKTQTANVVLILILIAIIIFLLKQKYKFHR